MQDQVLALHPQHCTDPKPFWKPGVAPPPECSCLVLVQAEIVPGTEQAQ